MERWLRNLNYDNIHWIFNIHNIHWIWIYLNIIKSIPMRLDISQKIWKIKKLACHLYESLPSIRGQGDLQVTWDDVRDFLDNELRDRPFEPHELLMKLRFIDETSSGMSTIRHNSFQSDFFRDAEYLRRITAIRPEQPAFL